MEITNLSEFKQEKNEKVKFQKGEQIDYSLFPEALKGYRMFGQFKIEDGQKVPYQARLKYKAACNNHEHKCTFGWAEKLDDKTGINICPDFGFWVIDFDKCLVDGVLIPPAQKIFDKLNSWSEVSYSGNGLHIIVKADIKHNNDKCQYSIAFPEFGEAAKIEFFRRYHWISLTGWHIDGTPLTVEDRTAQLFEILNTNIPKWNEKEIRPEIKPYTGKLDTNDRLAIARIVAATFDTDIPQGIDRANKTCFAYAGSLIHGCCLTPDEAIDIFLEWGSNCYPAWTFNELMYKLKDQARKPQGYSGSIGDKLAEYEKTLKFERAEAITGLAQPVEATILPKGAAAPLGEPESRQEPAKSLKSPIQQAQEAILGESAPEPQKEFSYKCNPASAAELAEMEFPIEWLIKNILVAGQPGVIAGPKKCLKTGISMDLAISLGSGTAFLGNWGVPKKVNTLLVSAESGGATLKETALRICASRYIQLKDCSCWFDFRLPRVSVLEELNELITKIKELQIKVCILDPAYLCLLAGSDAQASNVFDMGELLAEIAFHFKNAGCTLLLAVHSRKGFKDNFNELDLEDISFVGLQEFARQWILLNRRRAYRFDGEHDLHMVVGSSVGFGGYYGVDVSEGLIKEDFTGRYWRTRILSKQQIEEEKDLNKELRTKQKELEKQEKDNEALQHLLSLIPSAPTVSKTALKQLTGFNSAKFDRLTAMLESQRLIKSVSQKNKNNRDTDFYILMPTGE